MFFACPDQLCDKAVFLSTERDDHFIDLCSGQGLLNGFTILRLHQPFDADTQLRLVCNIPLILLCQRACPNHDFVLDVITLGMHLLYDKTDQGLFAPEQGECQEIKYDDDAAAEILQSEDEEKRGSDQNGSRRADDQDRKLPGHIPGP